MGKSKSTASNTSPKDNIDIGGTGGTGKSPPDQRNEDTVVEPGGPSAVTLDVLSKLDGLSLDDILALKSKCDLRLALETKPSEDDDKSNIKRDKWIPPWEKREKTSTTFDFGRQFDEMTSGRRPFDEMTSDPNDGDVRGNFKGLSDQELENLRGFRPTQENFQPRETTGEDYYSTNFDENAYGRNSTPAFSPTYQGNTTAFRPPQNRTVSSTHGNVNTTTTTATTPPQQPSQFHHGLPSGFKLRPAARPDDQANYEADRIAISRNNRGTTEKERAKIRELCTKGIVPLLSSGSVKNLLTSDGKEYDISKDAMNWKTGIDNMWRHSVAYDFKTLFLIPSIFDIMTGVVPSHATYTNAIKDHDKIGKSTALKWQEFVRRFGSNEELTSDAWMEEKLWKSLDSTLYDEVASDFLELPDRCKGSISLARLIIDRMVQKNQESRRALEEYIKSFDIRNFPGEDVSAACLRVKGIAYALGTDRLPSDIIFRIIEGFARASTPEFRSMCDAQSAILSTSLFQDNLRPTSLYHQLVSVLRDLENRFIDLRSGQRWLGVGHGASPTTSAFVSGADYDDTSNDDEVTYEIYLSNAGNKALPFDVWVKDKNCHYCGELGHIRPHCLKYLREQKKNGRSSVGTNKEYAKHNHRSHERRTSPSPHNKGESKSFKKFFKGIYTAAKEGGYISDSSSSSSENEADDKVAAALLPSSEQNHSAFFSALGCRPKE